MKIIGISDTHNKHDKLVIPECDILIHAGDESLRGTEEETRNFAKWFNKQPARYKIWTPGNHSIDFEKNYPLSLTWFKEECSNGIALIHNLVEVEGIKIFGSPYTTYYSNLAYNIKGNAMERLWAQIPDDVNILITHSPPYGILDDTPSKKLVGCMYLYKRVFQIKPDLHLFGHVHHQGNMEKHIEGRSFYNVAVCDEQYLPTNGFKIIDYEKV